MYVHVHVQLNSSGELRCIYLGYFIYPIKGGQDVIVDHNLTKSSSHVDWTTNAWEQGQGKGEAPVRANNNGLCLGRSYPRPMSSRCVRFCPWQQKSDFGSLNLMRGPMGKNRPVVDLRVRGGNEASIRVACHVLVSLHLFSSLILPARIRFLLSPRYQHFLILLLLLPTSFSFIVKLTVCQTSVTHILFCKLST